ncbi:choice-of-anchor D domain-containing protein [Pseudoduganella namucuonensis]|uniref:Abnormal spindle-like microcephaly-assoc'd, ASPM-SPD-2-Hydin n=1 Tax=Pseudoduganella namucuonensis TaxID=1035707 RepID=A0A1I7KTA4_9BURK|nr:choice-of-anchor D domain-containing protein [Pseudoduganella namucuonensis]SFV00681.1 Abnormal spindle-like microcephaly-assoc'd, ASPM-SPD-2-Hydin [Pseudoduganella namucuonensis]
MTGYKQHQFALRGLGALLVLGGALQSAHAADALNGKSLYLNGPASGGASCAGCHGASPASNVNGILRAANAPSVISAAFAANRGGMGALFNGKFSAAEIADLAAFIGDPNVTAAPAASLSPASLSFSGTTVGQSAGALSATLSNTGSAALTIASIGLSGAASADYSVSGGTCAAGGSVAAGANCTVQVTFKPASAGARAATLTIAHNATGGSSTVSLSGTGNAAAQATIALSATSVNFGALLTNTASAPQTVTVSNSGQAALTLGAITLGGANSGIFTLGGSCSTAAPVAAGGNCTLTVLATPTAAGAFSGSVTLASNASNGNATIGLSGSGAAAAPAVAANPTALAFGAQTVGAAAVTQNVTLTNSGNVALNIASIAVSGASGVAIGSGNSCGATLAVNANCTVPVVFTPATAGDVAATLLVRSNAADLRVAITGSGTTAAVAKPALSDTGAVKFADTQLGKSSAAHSTTLRNDGSAALKIATLTLGGANAGDFTLGGSCAVNGTLSPAASCTVDSVFKPTAAGARSADLVLVTDGGAQFTLGLGGNGVAVPAGAALTVNPQSFDFGAATVGGTAPTKRFALTNSGSAAVTLSGAVYTGPFATVADATGCAAMPFTLQPGASCELVVRYTPATAGASSGSVQIQGDGGASWTVSLAGQASAAPAVTGPTQPQNSGGGGCSAVRDGSDPMLALLVLMSLGVLGWRRATRATGATQPSNKEAA